MLLLKDGLYMLSAGDAGALIARKFEMKLTDLVSLNPEVNWSKLKVGQVIKVHAVKLNTASSQTLPAVTSSSVQAPLQP